jgi:hypothetical protein
MSVENALGIDQVVQHLASVRLPARNYRCYRGKSVF